MRKARTVQMGCKLGCRLIPLRGCEAREPAKRQQDAREAAVTYLIRLTTGSDLHFPSVLQIWAVVVPAATVPL